MTEYIVPVSHYRRIDIVISQQTTEKTREFRRVAESGPDSLKNRTNGARLGGEEESRNINAGLREARKTKVHV